MSFVFDLPLWIVGLALVLVMCSLAAVGLRFARRRVLPRFEFTEGDGHFTSTIVHSVMVFYALAVAMIAITAWETYDAAAKIVSRGVERINRFQKILTSFEPTTEGEKIFHAETMRSYDHLIDARRMRLDAVQTALPGLMWTVIFVGAALAVVGSYFFRVRDPRLHLALVMLLTTFFALVIFVVLAFDRPFRGDMGIESEPYELVYDQLMKR